MYLKEDNEKWKLLIIAFSVSLIIFFTFLYLQVNPITALMAFPEFVIFFAKNFCPPDFKNIATYIPLILETVLFAVVGTYISAVFSFFFGLLLSEKTNRIAPLRFVARIFISFLRNISVLVWAALIRNPLMKWQALNWNP